MYISSNQYEHRYNEETLHSIDGKIKKESKLNTTHLTKQVSFTIYKSCSHEVLAKNYHQSSILKAR
jgi:hypothetical protein